MAHKTMAGGTAYAVTGGKTMVDGTVYSIAKGRTMIGGTLYDIPFAHDVTITITRSGVTDSAYYSYASVEIDGTIYLGSTVLQVPAGTEILCTCSVSNNTSLSEIKRNGVVVASKSYTFQATQDTKIVVSTNMKPATAGSTKMIYYGTITITD